MRNMLFLITVAVLALVLVYGCGPSNLALKSEFWQAKDRKIGIAVAKSPVAATHQAGGGLLDQAIAKAATGTLDAHLQSINSSNFDDIRQKFVDNLTARGFNVKLIEKPFDLEKAAALLTEAGWRDTDNDGLRDKQVNGRVVSFEFSFLIGSGFPEYTALATIFKEDLLKIGVKLNIESAEWALLLKRTDEREFDAVLMGWALSWLNDPFQIWHSSQVDTPGGSNRTGFRNKEADALIEKLRETFDPGERQRMMHRLHRLIVDSHSYTFVITEQRPFCYSKAVKGVRYAKLRPLEYTLPWSVDMN